MARPKNINYKYAFPFLLFPAISLLQKAISSLYSDIATMGTFSSSPSPRPEFWRDLQPLLTHAPYRTRFGPGASGMHPSMHLDVIPSMQQLNAVSGFSFCPYSLLTP